MQASMADMRPPIEFETAAWTNCSIRNWKAATDGVTAVETEELGAVVVGGSMTEEKENLIAPTAQRINN